MGVHGLRGRDLEQPAAALHLHAQWAEEDGSCYPMLLGGLRAPNLIFAHDQDGSTQPDGDGVDFEPGRIHGKRLLDVGSQTPIPIRIGGGSFLGPTGKAPATMGVGSDCVSQVTRYQRYPAIADIRPETTGTIGSVARQSRQYVREQMPDKRPRNAWSTDNPPGPEIRTIGSTIPPALEPPRHNLAGLNTDYIQQQQDLLDIKSMMIERGMSVR